MKKPPIKIRFWLQFTAVVIVSLFLLGWGATGHRIINKSGARDFPNLSIVSPSIIQRLADSASVPDIRSGNPSEPKHFMDMEDISEFSTHSITHNRDSLFLKYGETYIRNTVGFLPWVIDSVMSVLTDQMRSGDWNKAWSSAGDLGHYIGDAHQPLHATTNYNGYTTKYGSGSYGIHSRYETTMINSYQSSIFIDSSAVHLIPNPLDTAFAIMYQSNSYVDSIYIADQYARTVVGSTVPQAYTDSLWVKTKNFTVLQFRRAAVEYGSFLYTAWVNASKPSTFVEQWANQVREFHLGQNYPNPFNPTTVISYQVAVGSSVRVSVFDILGREVAILVNEKKPAGSYQVQWNASREPSGVYFYRLSAVPSVQRDLVPTEGQNGQAGGILQTRKMLLLK
jgi:hypothetical protein